MRCMLASFATFNLWLDWRAISGHLARCFLDYEPGIHYVQLQLHAGTCGRVAVYNPTKQAKDHDPQGVFIRKYVPELADVSITFLHEPWKLARGRRDCSTVPNTSYPMPIVSPSLRTANASRKVMETAHKTLGELESEMQWALRGEDAELQAALEASSPQASSPQASIEEEVEREDLQWALQETQAATQQAAQQAASQEEAELQRAIEASQEEAEFQRALEASREEAELRRAIDASLAAAPAAASG